MNINQIDLLPLKPGVYKFYDKNKKLLYIGKALNLRNRVKSYFNDTLYDRPYVKKMIPLIQEVEIVETNNEIESLVLEAALIKELKPKYNTLLKDDKSYAWIYVSTKDEFPLIKISRNVTSKELKRGELFGPYPNIHSARRVFTYLRKLYPFCTCSPERAKREKECMYFHIGLCPGPYQGHITKAEYRRNITEILKFLKGRKRGQIAKLESKMKQYSKEKEYEKAGELRDKIEDLKYLGEKINFEYNESSESYITRRKKLLQSNFQELKIELGLKKLNRIECYDISNIQGKEAYGSMVVAENGEIKRSQYRIFKIKTIDTPNDTQMLKEVLTRRFNKKQREKYNSYPEIVLIDGGKGQLSVVESSIPKDIYLLGITKGRKYKRKGGRLLDEFWYMNRDSKKVEKIKVVNKEILIDLRDEAHRFAILHHRKARVRESKKSELLKINGVGEKSRVKLLKNFKSIENIKKASLEDINMVLNNKKISKLVYEYFRKN